MRKTKGEVEIYEGETEEVYEGEKAREGGVYKGETDIQVFSLTCHRSPVEIVVMVAGQEGAVFIYTSPERNKCEIIKSI